MFSNNFFKDKVVIITGAGRGIGKSTALMFAELGSKIVICARSEKELRETKNEILYKKAESIAIKADVSKLSNIKAVIKETIKSFKKIDILINNAGIGPYKPLLETSDEEIDNTLDINLKGLIHFTKEALPYLQKQDYGRIINISSGIGKVGMANFAPYCSTKFGVIGFTEALAGELPENIKTYSVCPGATNTKMYNDNFPNSRNFLIDSPKKVAKTILKTCQPDFNIKSGAAVDV